MNKGTISGVWDSGQAAAPPVELPSTKEIVFIPLNRRMFGVDWYPWRYLVGTCLLVGNALKGFEIRPQQPLERREAEWWRRLGYRILAWDWKKR